MRPVPKPANPGRISPDHVYLDRRIDLARFETLVKEATAKFLGSNPQASPYYSRVVNAFHHRRLVQFRDPAGETRAVWDRDLVSG